jgi:hypothetical protein
MGTRMLAAVWDGCSSWCYTDVWELRLRLQVALFSTLCTLVHSESTADLQVHMLDA